MGNRSDSQEHVRRLAEAAAWRVRLAETDTESSEAFEVWLAADPAHEAAWATVQATWSRFGDQATAPEIMAARRDALGRARRRGRMRWGRSSNAGRWAAAIAAVVVIAVGAGTWVWTSVQPQEFRTELGERRSVTLADESKIALDSNTVVQVRYERNARKLELLSGQARFDVAHDVERPFSVHARDQTIMATGTAFNVDLLGPKVLVTLIEGHVVVLADRATGRAGARAASPPSVELHAGQQLAVTGAKPPEVLAVSTDKATAWETGQIIVDDEPLADVAERVSRYADHPVVVRDQAAGALHLSGVFNVGDVSTFVDTVTRYLPVRAKVLPDGEIDLSHRS